MSKTRPEAPDCEPDRHEWEKVTIEGYDSEHRAEVGGPPDVLIPAHHCKRCGRVEIEEDRERAS